MRLLPLFLLCGIVVGFPELAAAQPLSKSDLLADLRFLDSAVRARNPSDKDTDAFAGIIASLEEPFDPSRTARTRGIIVLPRVGPPSYLGTMRWMPDSITHIQYRLAVGAALQAAGDGHALILKNPLARPDSLYFPLPVALVDRKLILLRQCPEYPADFVGKEVIGINGVPTTDILTDLFHYAAADGGGTHFAEALVRINLIPLLTAYFGGSQHYNIEVAPSDGRPLSVDDIRTMRVDAIRTVRAGEPRFPTAALAPQAALRRGNNALHLRAADSTAILAVTSFSKKDRAFFRKAFSRMEEEGTSRLVIDLRGNTGGARSAAVALTKHLVDVPFDYSLVRPRGQRLRLYLNRKGRFFLTLARVKYGVGSFYRAHSTPQGRGYCYRYKPARNIYGGRLAVITDGLTISSSTMVTSWLKQYSHAFFVGSQAGGGYNGNWGGAFPRITLPKSGMVIQLPAYRLVLDETSAQRDGIVPNLTPRYTIADLLSHRDAALDTALNALSGTPWQVPGIHLKQQTP